MEGKGILDVDMELVDSYISQLPNAFIYDGCLLPVLSEEKMATLKEFQFGPNDIIIITYPKSGTIWTSEIVSAICNKGDTAKLLQQTVDERVPFFEFLLSETRTRAEAQNMYTSFGNGTGNFRVWRTHLSSNLLPKTALERGCKLIYVSRNPKDVAVSYFHFHRMTIILGKQTPTWNQFLSLFSAGKVCFGSWFDHVKEYWNLSNVHQQNMFFVKYEDMKKDLHGEVSKISEFLGVELSPEAQVKVVEHCSFNMMKNNKMTDMSNVKWLDFSQGQFLRKGVIGDWKKYFTVAENECFDKIYEEKMNETDLEFEFDPNV